MGFLRFRNQIKKILINEPGSCECVKRVTIAVVKDRSSRENGHKNCGKTPLRDNFRTHLNAQEGNAFHLH